MKYILVLVSILFLVSACSIIDKTAEPTINVTSDEQTDISNAPPICNTNETEMECLTKKAIWYKDISYCEKFISFDFYGVSDCYSNAVSEIKDPSICNKIESNRTNKLTTEQLMNSCYRTTVHVMRDIAICDNIQDIEEKIDCKEQTEIDFSNCNADKRIIYVGYGSTTYEIIGKEGDNCLMNYGGEVENPEWDGKLTTKCQVPLSFGKQIFFKTDYGVDFSPLRDYCIS